MQWEFPGGLCTMQPRATTAGKDKLTCHGYLRSDDLAIAWRRKPGTMGA